MSQDIHRVLHSAYSTLRGAEANKATASITLDHLIQEQIRSIKGGETRALLNGRGESVGRRYSKLDRLEELKRNVSSAVEAIISAGDDEGKLAALGLTSERST